jgi:mannose-6-phosphate isomerase
VATTPSTSRIAPVDLGPNQPPDRFYTGGPGIAGFRGGPGGGDRVPEDWVASTTTLFASDQLGLTRLPSGELLRDAVRRDPVAWLGAEHVAHFGSEPALLVKLLDAGERLPVHVHPDTTFAARHLDCPFGKTEAWIILDAKPGAVVHLGFRSDVSPETVRTWVSTQDTDAMLAAMHTVPVQAGDAVLVPAGIPHAIGEGVLLVELQEPTDFSVLLEWSGFRIDGARDGHLGIGHDLALECVDRSGWTAERLAGLRSRPDGAQRQDPFPASAAPFFRAERLRPLADGHLDLDAGFSVLVVAAGQGELRMAGGDSWALRRGMTVVVPHAAGTSRLEGAVEVLRCRPPAAR